LPLAAPPESPPRLIPGFNIPALPGPLPDFQP
jgi:hypothetical protein